MATTTVRYGNASRRDILRDVYRHLTGVNDVFTAEGVENEDVERLIWEQLYGRDYSEETARIELLLAGYLPNYMGMWSIYHNRTGTFRAYDTAIEANYQRRRETS